MTIQTMNNQQNRLPQIRQLMQQQGKPETARPAFNLCKKRTRKFPVTKKELILSPSPSPDETSTKAL